MVSILPFPAPSRRAFALSSTKNETLWHTSASDSISLLTSSSVLDAFGCAFRRIGSYDHFGRHKGSREARKYARYKRRPSRTPLFLRALCANEQQLQSRASRHPENNELKSMYSWPHAARAFWIKDHVSVDFAVREEISSRHRSAIDESASKASKRTVANASLITFTHLLLEIRMLTPDLKMLDYTPWKLLSDFDLVANY